MPTPVKLERKPTKEELLARVTGKQQPPSTLPPAKRAVTPMPPSAMKLPPGVTGTPPMPSNKVVGAIAPSSLLPEEREALEGIGWTDDMPIPENFADAFDSIKAEHAARAVLPPVDPTAKPFVPPEPVPADQVDPETRARLKGVMERMVAETQEAAAQAQEDAERQLKEAVIPGLREARMQAERATKSAASDEPVIEVPAAAVPSKVADKVDPAAKVASPTGADARPANCPHCNWDLGQEDVAEPDQATKLAFVQCLLGVKPFVQRVDLLGGAVEATFRSLTIKEVEACYAQVYQDQKNGKLETDLDYWERLNRYRLYLQLQALKAVGPGGFSHDLPDGLDKASNPTAMATWQDSNDPPDTGETLLPLIETYVTEKVLPQEAIFRIVNTACNRFNRLVSKLEAMADNSDFWKPTGAAS